MKATLIFAAALSIGIAGFTTGCQTGGARPPVNTNKYNLESQAKFVLLDSGTQRSVTSPGLQERPLDDGRMEVVAKLRNRENRRIQVQVNCNFKDAQGFVVEETPWQTVFLDENAMNDVRFVSMKTGAKDYTVRVRQAR
jgi:hypothetical protein